MVLKYRNKQSLLIFHILQSLESGMVNNSPTIRRAHSEEMLSELDLNIIGTSANGREGMVDPKKQPQNKSMTTNQKPQHYHQNGEFSST